jgi:hypothetical protein
MDTSLTTKTLLARRKLTRTIGQLLSEQLRSHITTLTPLFRQRQVFGDHVQGRGASETVKNADHAFKELQELYAAVAAKPPFMLPSELNSPLMQLTSTLELSPWEYDHVVSSGSKEQKTVRVTSPFRFVLTYGGYSPRRLKDLLNDQGRKSGELQVYVLHYLTMHMMVQKQPGLAHLLDTLHFPLSTAHVDGLGKLPVTFVGSSISTSLPADALVMESTEMSGMDVFEEIVNPADIENLRDPLRERLVALLNGDERHVA